MKETYVTLTVALISAAVALVGYMNERRKERELELAKIREKIYQDFITNYFTGASAFRDVLADPACPKGDISAIYSFGVAKYPKFEKFLISFLRTNTLLSVYGAGPAVKKAAEMMRHSAEFAQGIRKEPADVGAMILELRRQLFAPPPAVTDTDVTSADINQLMTP